MSYISLPFHKQDINTSLDSGVVNIAKANEHTAGQSGESRFASTSVFSGLAFAAVMAFMNLGSPTATNQSYMNNSLQSVNTINRNKKIEIDTDASSDENYIKLSQSLQGHFGFKTAQWAKILKVERKTIYNWKGNSETKVRTDAARRIISLSDFAKTFKTEHSLLFSKFIFGSKVNNELSTALLRDTLDVSEIVDAYYKIYTEIDGAVKRKKLLG